MSIEVLSDRRELLGGAITGYGKEEIRANETACERGHDRAHRPRQDDADRSDHEGSCQAQSEEQVP